MKSVMSRLRRAVLLVLAAILCGSALGPAMPARADDPIVRDHRDPTARLLLVIKRIIVHDDMDWGTGEVDISYEVRTSAEPCALYNRQFGDGSACGRVVVAGRLPKFPATDGSQHRAEWTVPSAGDSMADSSVSPELGIPIRAGQWYGLSVTGIENDEYNDDEMGTLEADIASQDGQVRFGTRTERGIDRCGHGLGNTFCPPADLAPAAFSVEYEIRRAPLPDLRPASIKVHDIPGSTRKLVCVGIQNVEAGDAGPFELLLRVDGVVPPGGSTTVGGLASGRGGDLCIDPELPATGQHQLTAVVDHPRAVTEFNETNNVYSQPYTAAGAASNAGTGAGPDTADPNDGPDPVPSPTPSPISALPDLTVRAIRVNGQAPDGKDDCKDGKNDVTVVVKNGGTGKAEKFAVRLTVDGGEAAETAVDVLEAGQEHEVRVDDLRLKKGDRTLLAVADATKAIAESKEENNERKVTARCQGDD